MARKSTYAYTDQHEQDKKIVRGLNYDNGEWTGLYFQPVLLCAHRRAELRSRGWVLEQNETYYSGTGFNSVSQFFPHQKCEVTA